MEAVDAYVTELAHRLGRDPAVVRGMVVMVGLLLVGSVLRGAAGVASWRAGRVGWTRRRLLSLVTWWLIAAALWAVLAAGELLLILLMAGASALGLREYLRGMHPARPTRAVTLLAYAMVLVQYGSVAWGPSELALAAVPALTAVGLLAVRLGGVVGRQHAERRSGEYVASAGSLLLGVMLCVYLPAFVVMLPTAVAGQGGVDPLAPALLLVWLTLTHDIVSALVGRAVGRRAIVPTISPGKTWAGAVAGVTATTALGGVAGPGVMSVGWAGGAGAGLVVAVGGFLGDANMSAIKRDRGLKDSGDLVPGQGGVLDRLDSLGFAAPLLFVYLHLL